MHPENPSQSTLSLLWPPPPAGFVLTPQAVHVWGAVLSLADSQVAALARLLTDDEQARAAGFHFARHRCRFIVARGVLRLLLGQYLGMPPQHVRFIYGPQGKPALAPQCGGDLWRFNLSYSDDLALYAFTRQRQLGIDVEKIQPAFAATGGIAERFFAPREVAALRSLPVTQQTAAFFACWSRKEAYIKARGLGLSLPLDSFEVSLRPHEPAALLHTAEGPSETARWSLRTLHPAPGYAAALMVEGHDWHLECWQKAF